MGDTTITNTTWDKCYLKATEKGLIMGDGKTVFITNIPPLVINNVKLEDK